MQLPGIEPTAEQTLQDLDTPELSGHRAGYSLHISRHQFRSQLPQNSQTHLTTVALYTDPLRRWTPQRDRDYTG